MKYRQLTADHDYTFGNGRSCYISDIDAVAQAIKTRLLLFLEEWWEDQSDGIPMWQKMLGVYGARKEVNDRLIQERILGTQNVTEIVSFASQLNRETRAYAFQCTVNTVYGQITTTGGTAQ